MVTIVTQTADNAYHIQDAFREMNRDHYPLNVYEAIFDFITQTYADNEPYHLDVIAWCCDLSETTLTDSDFEGIDELANYLQEHTTVLYVDEDNETIYHLVY